MSCKELANYAIRYFARAEPRAISDELRAQGNDTYTSIHDGLAPTIFASRLQTSMELYTKAVETANTPEQMASASKNLGFAHRKHAYKESNFDVRMRHLCTFVRHLCNAYVFGAACKPAACIKQRLRWLEKLSAAVSDAWASQKADITLFQADDTVKEALLALSGEELGAVDHMLCKHLMEEAARPIEDALRFSRVASYTKGHHEAAMLKDEAGGRLGRWAFLCGRPVGTTGGPVGTSVGTCGGPVGTNGGPVGTSGGRWAQPVPMVGRWALPVGRWAFVVGRWAQPVGT
ncbi:hypothetical protein COCOBI_12-5720 [Coccomyxa sp. Obi]|nr:hypothetical protein COCOBI_12-5720 [Coccomyxa sp. Obi]